MFCCVDERVVQLCCGNNFSLDQFGCCRRSFEARFRCCIQTGNCLGVAFEHERCGAANTICNSVRNCTKKFVDGGGGEEEMSHCNCRYNYAHNVVETLHQSHWAQFMVRVPMVSRKMQVCRGEAFFFSCVLLNFRESCANLLKSLLQFRP
jgi:hypothetical protein